MEIDQIQAWIAVLQAGGFSNASAILHLSQPAISRRISLLEQELGARLIERLPGKIVPTAAGEAFLPHAQRVLAALRDGKEAVQSLANQEEGGIQIAIVGTLASTDFTRQLLAFRKLHPKVQLELRTGRSFEISRMVQTGEIHIGIRYFPDPSPDLISREVRQDALAVVVSSQRRFDKKRLRAKDLRGIPWITFPASSSAEPYAQHLLEQLQKANLKNAKLITIDSLTAQKRLVEADFGVALMPVSAIQEELRLGTLQMLKIPELRSSIPVTVIHRRGGYLSKAAQSLLNTLLRTRPRESGM